MTECAECNLAYRLGVICSFVCVCSKAPSIGAKGEKLKQVCVDKGLGSMQSAGVLPGVHPEMGWLMSAPPQALVQGNGTQAHKLGGMIGKARKLLGKDKTEKLGKGQFRIPDVTMVPDPSKPASPDNLQALVEIKFKGDQWGDGQKEAYLKLADDKPFILMGDPPKSSNPDAETFCQCEGKKQRKYQPEGQPVPQPALHWDKAGRPDTYPLPDDPVSEPGVGWGKIGLGLGLIAVAAVAILAAPATMAVVATLGLASSVAASEELDQAFPE